MLLAWSLTITSHQLGVAHWYQEAVFVRTWSVLPLLDGENSLIATFPLPNNDVPFTVFMLVPLTNVGCTAMFQLHNTLVLLIVLILVQLVNLSCFQLNVAKSSFFRYQSALELVAHSLVFIEL
jgi:hypothetical protein